MPIPANPGDLVVASDLAAYEGAPFTDEVVATVADFVRGYAEWHIAPQRSETVVVESYGGDTLLVPTMHLVEVTAVRNVTTADPAVVLDYRNDTTPAFRAGVLTRWGCWPRGVLEVDIVHGYEACPQALLGVIAELCRAQSRGDLKSRTVGPFSETYAADLLPTERAVLDRYRLPPRP